MGLARGITALALCMPQACTDGRMPETPPPPPPAMQVYMGSLHGHSNYSDGDDAPADVLTWAAERMDFYVLSDHAELLDDGEWQQLAALTDARDQPNSFVVLRAFEYSSPFEGHANVFDTSERQGFSLPGFQAFYAWLSGRSGIAQFNHPGEHGSFADYAYAPEVAAQLRFMETANADQKNASGRYLPLYALALARGWKLAPTANLDNHSLKDSGIRTGVLAPALTRADLLQALRERRVFSTDDAGLTVRFSMGDRWMGAELRSEPRPHTFVVEASSRQGIASVELWLNGQLVRRQDVGAREVRWSPSLHIAADAYVAVRATEDDGDMALSAPIWLDLP